MAQSLQIALIIALFIVEMMILRKVFNKQTAQALSVLVADKDSLETSPVDDDSVQVPPYIGRQPAFIALSQKHNSEKHNSEEHSSEENNEVKK